LAFTRKYAFLLDGCHLNSRCSGLNVIAFLMIVLWVPETKQRTLEELDYVCTYIQSMSLQALSNFRCLPSVGVPTSRFASYQVKKALPYGIKRYFLFDSTAELEPLYHFDGVQDADHPEVERINIARPVSKT
jgi:hypothetical protein